MDSQQDLKGLRELLIVGTRISLLIALPLCLGFVFLGRQFITLWMGTEYAVSATFLAVLAIPQFTAMSQYMATLVLAGMAKHKVLAYLVLAEGLANLVLSIILVRKMGLIGVAWGTVIPDLILTAVVIPWYTLGKLQLGFREYLVRGFVRPVISVLPVVGLAFAFSRLTTPSWAIFGVEVAVIAGTVAIMGYFLCLNSGHRAMAHKKVRQVLQRVPVTHSA
jgi:O-antigen/teichoic acid export membrane protein